MADQVLQYALTGDASGAKAAFADVGASIANTAKQIEAASKSTSAIAAKLDAAAESALKQAASSKEASAIAGELNRSLQSVGVTIPGLEAGFTALSNPVVTMTAVVVGAGVAMSKFALENADLVEHLGNLEAVTGLTIDQLYGMRDVALSSGVEFDGMAKSVAKMETEIGKGNKELKALGLTGGDAIDDVARVADAWNAATSQTEKNRIAMAAFGKGFAEMIPVLREGGAAIRSMGEGKQIDVQKYNELDETMDSISQSWRDIKFALGDMVAGPLDLLLSGAGELLLTLKEAAEYWDRVFTGGPRADPRTEARNKIIETYAYYQDKRKEGEKLLGKVDTPLRIQGMTLQDALFAFDQNNPKAPPKTAGFGETDEEKAARKKAEEAAQKELEFRADLYRQIDEMVATADQRELVAIQNKYAKLLEQHEAYGESLNAIKEAQAAELQAFYMRQNFANLASQRDQDKTSTDFANQQNRREFQNPWTSNEEARAARRLQNLGLIGENGVGIVDATQMSLKEMTDLADQAEASTKQATLASIQASAEIQQAWEGVSESIASTAASNLAPVLVNAFVRPREALEQLGEAGGKILSDLATQLMEVGLKWSFLSLLAAGTGGEGPGGFLKFLTKSFGGHAEGTLSSPGGLRYLGEQGPELVTTPMGSRYMASYGLYHVPSGTRVEKAQGKSIHFAPQIIIQGTSDAAQTAEIVDRRIRELYASLEDDSYRSRIS